jgi:hypothetical protein
VRNDQSVTWLVQPTWVKKLSFFVGLPVWLAWLALLFTGKISEQQTLALCLFGIFAFVAVTQLFFVARAFWRYDI